MTGTNHECPCYECKHSLYCKWACEKLNKYAEGKTFAEIAEEFVKSYKYAAQQKRAVQKS